LTHRASDQSEDVHAPPSPLRRPRTEHPAANTVADPLTYVMTVAVFVAVGLFSGWLPATRATRVDTVQTLSAE